MVFRTIETVVYHIPRRLTLRGVDEAGVEPLIWNLILHRTTDRIPSLDEISCLRSHLGDD